MAITLGQSAIANVEGTNALSVALNGVQAGSLLGLYFSAYYFLGPTWALPTDTQSNTWQYHPTPLDSGGWSESSGGDVILHSCYATNVAAGNTTVTIGSGQATQDWVGILCEWRGIDAGNPINGTPLKCTNENSTNPGNGSITPAVYPAVSVFFASHSGGNLSWTPGSGQTLIASRDDGTTGAVIFASYIAIASDSNSPDCTTSGTVQNFAHAVALREGAGAAGSAPVFGRHAAGLMGR